MKKQEHSDPDRIFTKLIETITVKAQGQCKLAIGTTVGGQPPKGFSIELMPAPIPSDTVTVTVDTRGSHTYYDYILHIANNSAKSVRAEIRQM